jgi:hypothetical protein
VLFLSQTGKYCPTSQTTTGSYHGNFTTPLELARTGFSVLFFRYAYSSGSRLLLLDVRPVCHFQGFIFRSHQERVLSYLRLLSLLFALMWSCWTARGLSQSGFLMDTSHQGLNTTTFIYGLFFFFLIPDSRDVVPHQTPGPLLAPNHSTRQACLTSPTTWTCFRPVHRIHRTGLQWTSLFFTLLHSCAYSDSWHGTTLPGT